MSLNMGMSTRTAALQRGPMLDAPELRRRIRAARELRGLEQADLDCRFAADGLKKQEASRLERGELPWTAVRARALAYHLGMPLRWFTEPNIDVLLSEIRSTPQASNVSLPAPEGALGRDIAAGPPTQEARPDSEPQPEEGNRGGSAG